VVVASYKTVWQPLSADHEKIAKKISDIVIDYADGRLGHFSYAVIGTFGAGKTQLLYRIHQIALEHKLLPLYFFAEDLFRDILALPDGKSATPGEIFSIVQGRIDEAQRAISAGREEDARRTIDPRGKLAADAPELLNSLMREFSGVPVETLKAVLLVDELEGQYGNLQEKALTRDRSPLREWLENTSHLKFLSFAPAGIYELGGADRGRIKRLVLPSADIDYIRKHLLNDAGSSNSVWWLSRGKARQLFKTIEVLKENGNNFDAAQASTVIRTHLDSIGQNPTIVPPAVVDKFAPSKVSFILNLRPIKSETKKRYVIDAGKLDAGTVADKIVEAFDIGKNNAMLIADYFKRTAKALSDDQWLVYIDDRDLPELFSLALDHLLEYEHGSPEISSNLGEILNLYERIRRESASLYGTFGRLWEFKETDFALPFTILEIRDAFPFPSMSPTVRNHLPNDVRSKWEGKGLPVWKWSEGGIKILFFASQRDMLSYIETDSFVSEVLPDGGGALCAIATGETPKEEKPFLKWLLENRKLGIVELPSLLTDFLLSAAGEVDDIPADLRQRMNSMKASKDDVLLSRKAEIYDEAIDEVVSDNLPKPDTLIKSALPDAEIIWGRGQMDRDIAIMGIALAFTDLTTQERDLLANMRELFRSGKEGRGIGDLNPVTPRGGYIGLADDLLPRIIRKKELRDSEPIGRLRSYWRDQEKNALADLARILPMPSFLRLHPDENANRLLEALWKVARRDFKVEHLEALIQRYETGVLPVLGDCQALEQEVKRELSASGIDFGINSEKLVKAKGGVQALIDIGKNAVALSGSSNDLLRYIVHSFMSALINNIESDVRNLGTLCNSTRIVFTELKRAADNFNRNFYEYPKAVRFAGLSEQLRDDTIGAQMKTTGTPTLEQLQASMKESKEYLEALSRELSNLERDLKGLEMVFNQARGAG